MLACGIYNETYSQEITLLRTRTHKALMFGAVVVALLLPMFGSESLTNWLTMVTITVIAALGLTVTTGYCGLPSIGHAAFMAVGAFTYANLARHGISWFAAILFGALSAGAVGALFGLSSVKVKGLYLALITLAAQFIVPWVLIEYFGGDRGVVPKPISVGDLRLTKPMHFYYLALPILLAVTYLVFNLGRTKVGRAFKAISHQDIAAQAMGINISLYKVFSFAIGCSVAGIAGALWAAWMGRADIEHFTVKESIWYLAMIMLGGSSSVVGAYLGVLLILGISEISERLSTILVTVVPSFQSAMGALPSLLIAVAIITLILIEPRGLYHQWLIFKASYRVWPWPHW